MLYSSDITDNYLVYCPPTSVSHPHLSEITNYKSSTMATLSAAQMILLQSGITPGEPLDEASRFILEHGWAAATTRQYAAAVNKFFVFLKQQGSAETSQPFAANTIYMFMLWCSSVSTRRVSTSTIRRYLTGLRMWHILHDNAFPEVNADRIRLLLKSCTKTQTPVKAKTRVGLTLRDVVDLCDRLTSSNTLDLVTKAVILVGFWGLARLGELTGSQDHPSIFVRRKDVVFSTDGRSARITLREAKTALPGEPQFLRLRSQPNRLDPLNILHELLNVIPGGPNDPLFPGKSRIAPIKRSYVSNFLKANGPQDTRQWSGHSLRIGGASFQHDAGRSVHSLKRLGRWRSSVYKSYVSAYPPVLAKETRALSKLLHF